MAARVETDVLVVLCTFPSEDVAAATGRDLVERGLAACVNVVPTIQSIYRWQGEISVDREALAVIKTTSLRLAALTSELVSAHPYDCPEVLALPVVLGHPPYLDWVAAACRVSS